MLDMGFVDEVKQVARSLPVAHQTIMFSATMNRGVRSLAAGLLHNPELIEVGTENAVAANVDHRVMRVKHADKKALLMHLLARPEVARVLVFTRTKAMADLLVGDVRAAGHRADAIHGDREQSVRAQVLGDFRRGTLSVLIATDVAARGIDVPDITHVINYDMPVESDGYVHRVGRTGRAGAKGTALSICASGEGNLLRLVEQAIGQKVPLDIDHPFHDRDHHDRAAPRQKSKGFKKWASPHRNGARAFKPHGNQVQGATKADVPQKKRVDVMRVRDDAKPQGKPRLDRPAQAQAQDKRSFDGGFKPLSRKPRKA